MQIISKQGQGFTLLELIIAISIFSMISVMAYSSLKTVLNAKEANSIISKRVAASQIAFLRMTNDLRQTVSRTIRDGFGSKIAAMQTDQLGENTLEWTTAGYSNPAQFKRSTLQRITYSLIDNNLVRATWPVLDRAQNTEKNDLVLLSNVESLEWRFYDETDNWDTSWPPTSASSGTSLNSLPRAIEVKLTLSDIGEVRRLVLLPQG